MSSNTTCYSSSLPSSSRRFSTYAPAPVRALVENTLKSLTLPELSLTVTKSFINRNNKKFKTSNFSSLKVRNYSTDTPSSLVPVKSMLMRICISYKLKKNKGKSGIIEKVSAIFRIFCCNSIFLICFCNSLFSFKVNLSFLFNELTTLSSNSSLK